MLALFLFTVGICLTSAVLYVKAPCPEIKAIENFDIYKHTKSGWYEIARYPNDVERKGDCVIINFSNETDLVRFNISEVTNGEVSYWEGYHKLAPDAAKSGKIQIHSLNITQEEVEDSLLLYILDTDYDNYAVVYDCRYNETIETRHEYAWILSRSKKLEGEPRIAMENFVKSSGIIDIDKLTWDHFTEESCKVHVK